MDFDFVIVGASLQAYVLFTAWFEGPWVHQAAFVCLRDLEVELGNQTCMFDVCSSSGLLEGVIVEDACPNLLDSGVVGFLALIPNQLHC